MPEKYTYLMVDFFCILFPFAFSFHPKINFYKQWRLFALPCLITAAFFIIWDVVFTHIGVWSFNPQYVYGINIVNLPIEEYLFFLCIPYASVFTWYCIYTFFDLSKYFKAANIFSVSLILFLAVIAMLHTGRLYTSVTFLLLAFFLLVLLLMRVKFLPSFYLSFFIVLVPFFISNGVLTGSFTAQPVVVYNNAENLGIRMFTIPFEDTFYGMLLLMMNVAGFNFLKERA